jgi:hypothetical protein
MVVAHAALPQAAGHHPPAHRITEYPAQASGVLVFHLLFILAI